MSQKLLGTNTSAKRPESFHIFAILMSMSARSMTLSADFMWRFSKEPSNFSIHFPVKIPDTEERFLRPVTAFQHITAFFFFRMAFLFF